MLDAVKVQLNILFIFCSTAVPEKGPFRAATCRRDAVLIINLCNVRFVVSDGDISAGK